MSRMLMICVYRVGARGLIRSGVQGKSPDRRIIHHAPQIPDQVSTTNLYSFR